MENFCRLSSYRSKAEKNKIFQKEGNSWIIFHQKESLGHITIIAQKTCDASEITASTKWSINESKRTPYQETLKFSSPNVMSAAKTGPLPETL